MDEDCSLNVLFAGTCDCNETANAIFNQSHALSPESICRICYFPKFICLIYSPMGAADAYALWQRFTLSRRLKHVACRVHLIDWTHPLPWNIESYLLALGRWFTVSSCTSQSHSHGIFRDLPVANFLLTQCASIVDVMWPFCANLIAA